MAACVRVQLQWAGLVGAVRVPCPPTARAVKAAVKLKYGIAKREQTLFLPSGEIASGLVDGVLELRRSPPTCRWCGKDGVAQLCGLCRESPYCDEVCQRSHWPRHKRDCCKLK